MDRLGLFLFYDSEGIVDDYVQYMLDDMVQNLTDLCIIVNGELSPEGKDILENYTENIITRSNLGFDVGAWKDAMIQEYGFDRLAEYDEVILFNDSFFGPIYPFKEMFDEMDEKDLDFWAITVHGAAPDPRNLCPYPDRPRYLQLYFLVFRQNFIKSKEFQDYWQNMPYYENFNDVGYKHQAVFTKHFSDLGFKWAAYVDTEDLEESIDKSLSFHTYDMYELVTTRKLPVLKRKAFKLPRRSHLIFNYSMDVSSTLEYVDKNTDYDVSLIYKYFLRTMSPYELSNILNLKRIIPKNNVNENYVSDKKIAVFCSMYNDNSSDYVLNYLKNVPEYIDIIIATDTEDKKESINENIIPELNNNSRVIVQSFRQELFALLIDCKGIIRQYDYFCFMNDKEPEVDDYLTVRTSFKDILWENMLGSSGYINFIVKSFDEDSNLGLIVPPTPYHGIYFSSYSNKYWDSYYRDVEELFIRSKLDTQLSSDEPSLSIGNCFWAKVDALEPFLRLDYDTFFSKSMIDDDHVDHALERIYPYVAATKRYYTETVMTEEYGRNELSNYQYMLNETVNVVNKKSKDLVNLNKNFNAFVTSLRKGLINKNKFNLLKNANTIVNSSSWKITKPLRKVSSVFRKLFK